MAKKELKTNKEDEFIEQFDKSFKTNLKKKVNETPLLIDMFHNYISQEFKKSDLYESIIDELVSIEDDFRGSFTKEQKELFEKWESCRDELENYTIEQSFIYGYCLNNELQIESKK